jgi:hypothetical protein
MVYWGDVGNTSRRFSLQYPQGFCSPRIMDLTFILSTADLPITGLPLTWWIAGIKLEVDRSILQFLVQTCSYFLFNAHGCHKYVYGDLLKQMNL